MPRPVLLLAASLLVLVAACGDDDAGDRPPAQASLTPDFAPEGAAPAGSADQPASTPSTAGGGGPVTTAEVPPSTTATTATRPGGRASVRDPAGDLTPVIGARPPAWADLTGTVLERAGSGMEVRVSFAGAPPPAAPDDDHTMNVAAFFDVDGDGEVDYEVWANLAPAGWGGAWYDNREGSARFTDDSEVAVTVEAGALVLRFPATHVAEATRFRWSVASEWGPYATIGTVAAARDDAPDSDGSVTFPG